MWLLALALPMQGWASASMLCCGPDHHHVSIGAASVVQSTAAPSGSLPDSLSPAGGEGHEARGHHHAGHDHPADDHAANGGSSSQPNDEHGGGHHDLSKPGKTKCSVCASCCTIAALPSRTLIIDEAVPIQGVMAWTSQAPIAFLTSGPERPPRTSRS
ncbi:MAG: hypothetical protein K2X12_06055 [Burkholderiaceae bacterium]|nr:hypothetical protein [Burkholderiaceae bacterium]